MKGFPGETAYAPKTKLLVNGEMVMFKLLEKQDEQSLISFFSNVPEDEAKVLKDNVRDPKLISQWVQSLDYNRVLPLLALDEDSRRIVAASTLHFMRGVNRHIAGVRIFVGESHRKLGLGSAMLKDLIQISVERGLHFIKAEIPAQNQLAVRAFRQLGFETKSTLEDYFMSQDGETFDVALMMKRLHINMEGDFFYVF